MDTLNNLELFGFSVLLITKIIFGIFLSITFLQTGLDKVYNFKGNKDYFVDHFKGTLLEKSIPLLFPLIIGQELLAGILSSIGVILVLAGYDTVAQLGALISAIAFISLYSGQRLGKDYEGASSLVPYFITSVLGLIILSIGS